MSSTSSMSCKRALCTHACLPEDEKAALAGQMALHLASVALPAIHLAIGSARLACAAAHDLSCVGGQDTFSRCDDSIACDGCTHAQVAQAIPDLYRAQGLDLVHHPLTLLTTAMGTHKEIDTVFYDKSMNTIVVAECSNGPMQLSEQVCGTAFEYSIRAISRALFQRLIPLQQVGFLYCPYCATAWGLDNACLQHLLLSLPNRVC